MKKIAAAPPRIACIIFAAAVAACALSACTTTASVTAAPSASAASAAPVAPIVPTPPSDWQAAAIGDINAAYAQTVAHHPGMLDPLNPAFAAQLAAARDQGLSFANRVTDAASYRVAMQAFSAAIGDGHAGVSVRIPNQLAPTPKWPGFITVWRGDALLVYGSTVDGISRGDKIISCDTVPINALIERNVFQFIGRSKEQGLWWVRARNVLVDNANPAVLRPEHCALESAGKITRRKLEWRDIDKTFNDWRDASYNGDELAINLTTPSDKILWVAMPTFAPDEKGQAAYGALSKQLKARRKEALTARAVVLDLRHNQGGSSQWSRDVAMQLWGEAAVQARENKAIEKIQIWWRVTGANEQHINDLVALGKKENNTELVDFGNVASSGFANARKANKPFYIETNSAAPDGKSAAANTDFNQPVYVIVPGQCASACLDAVDTFSLFTNTKLIGAPSSADSTYMEIRTEKLPSGMAEVILPLKIWVNRPRGNGEFYKPAIEVTDLSWTTAAFLAVIENDLNANKK